MTIEPPAHNRKAQMPDTQITDEMVERAARAHNPFAFERDDDGSFLLEDIARTNTKGEVRKILEAALSGHVVVPREPTREMLSAAIDVDSFKLGDISPLGFRESPQMLFERCYRAMIQAAPPVPVERG